MDIEKYLESGIIEEYCLGIADADDAAQLEGFCRLYPEIQSALVQVQSALEGVAKQGAISPSRDLEPEILDRVDALILDELTLDENKLLSQFIDLSQYSDVAKWNELTKKIRVPEDFDLHQHFLYDDGRSSLFVLWVKEKVDDDEHDDLYEKILILQGTCRCKVGDEYLDFKAGEFIKVPLKTVHNLTVTSKEPVKLIVSRRMIA